MRQRGRGGLLVKARRADGPKARKVSTASPSIADLRRQLGVRNRELKEAREQQTASAEVLQIINSSQGDLAPVFDGILQRAIRLCDAAFGNLWLYDGDNFDLAAAQGPFPPSYLEMLSRAGQHAGPNTAMRRAVLTQQTIQIADYQLEQAYLDRDPVAVATAEVGKARTILAVPMVGEARAFGVFFVYRQEVRSFSKRQIALLQNFAAQAVVAMENARLLGELRDRTEDLDESLQQQTATADVLKVISRSAFDLQKVLDALTDSACRVCGAYDAVLLLRESEFLRIRSHHGPISIDYDKMQVSRDWAGGRSVVDRKFVHVRDLCSEGLEFPVGFDMAQRMNVRTILAMPLVREQEVIGTLTLRRAEVRPFTDKQIALAETFADQAVIAIENARLFEELRDRQAELARSVDELTATGDVLKIISRSSVELETVLDTLVDTVTRLCHADHASMFRRQDDVFQMVAARGLSEDAKEFILAQPPTADRGTISGRVASERRAVHVPDMLQDPEFTYREASKLTGARTMLGIPLLREDGLIGVFIIARTRVEPFTDKEIDLVTTFADQAVIAIENARLFDELRERQAELRVTFDNMGDGVVMFGADRRLVAWNRNFQEILDLPDDFLAQRPNYAEYFRYLAERGEYSADLEAELSRSLDDLSRELRFERTRPDGRVIEVRRNPVPGGGFVLIYADVTERKRAEEAIRAARDAAEAALRELQKTQASLVHAQKMAALGQLTAGIAHEIKNPLNFVNNFAGLSVELLEELKEAAGEAIGTLGAGKRTEILETISMLTGNLEKIAEHGRRADGIVRGMLQHSRGGSGDWQATDLNALVEESLNLAYHGARAQDQDFKVTVEMDLDRNLAPIEVVSQDVSRVLLNLLSNSFYAITKRGREGDGAFRPLLKIATRGFGEGVEIRVRDNGVGIPLEYREKLFQPFFTTKPTGEGTGLGLSISYEIVTQQHGGTIAVDSRVDDFTEFTVRLPRRRHAPSATE